MEARMYNLKLNSNNSIPDNDLITVENTLSDPENEITQLLSDEKKDRFETDVLIHLDALYTAALKLTNYTEDAESLIQKTLMNAFNSYINFTGSDFKLWILNVLTKTHNKRMA